jgi:hypothetical protein
VHIGTYNLNDLLIYQSFRLAGKTDWQDQQLKIVNIILYFCFDLDAVVQVLKDNVALLNPHNQLSKEGKNMYFIDIFYWFVFIPL